MPYLHILAGYVDEVFGGGPEQLGILISLIGVGALVGALFLASIRDGRRGLILLLSVTLMGVGLIGLAVVDSFYMAMPVMLVLGLGSAGRQALSNVLIQSNVEDAYRGRVMSVYMTQFSVMSFGTFGIGLISEAVRERFDFQEAWEVGASKLSPKQDEDAQELSGSVRQLEWMQAVFPSEEIERITKITRFRLAAVRAKHRKEIVQKGQQLAASLGTGREEEPPVLVDGKETEELPNGFGLKPYVRMEGTSMTGEGREGEIGTIHGNEPATEQAIRERVKAFIGRGGKVNFVIILGATNIRLGVMDDQGPVGGLLSQPWQRTGDPDRTRVGILAAMGELLFKRARELELAPGSVGRIGISWAGPGDYANGRVVGTNIEGFQTVDLQDRMVEQGGFPLARELADRLERGGFGDIPIEILHDGAAAAKGEYFLLTGRRADTTYTAGNVRNHIGEQGHFIVGVIGPNGEVRYENRAPEDGSSPSLRRFAGQFGQVGFVDAEF
ncbi:MAG: MFS transporter [Chloroflexi bacterium]|nr:MFS transporter [Chloroflexota bacterium]